MILTDGNYEIMTLLRSHRDDAKGLQIMARHPYPLHSIRLRQPVTSEQLAAALDAPEASTLRSECRNHQYALKRSGFWALSSRLTRATLVQIVLSRMSRSILEPRHF